MSEGASYFKGFASLVRKYSVEIFGIIAVLLFCISFVSPSYEFQLGREVRIVEHYLHQRQKIAEQYARMAIRSAPDDWMEFPDLPEDIVIYKYNLDTLQSWVHEFPVGNDEIGLYPFSYRLQYLSNNNAFSSPLAYMGEKETYVNLGSAWYVVQRHSSVSGAMDVVTGIRIKTQYSNDENTNMVNRKLRLRRRFTVVDIKEDAGAVVEGINGVPLFSIVSANDQAVDFWGSHLQWLAMLFTVVTLFLLHYQSRSWHSFAIFAAGLALIRLAAVLLSRGGSLSAGIFSPLLYADNNLFPSLADFLLNNTFVSLLVYALYRIRDCFRRIGNRDNSVIAGIIATVLAMAVGLYIHYVLKSLVLNSNLVLEPFRINELGGYAIICYFSIAMLFLALLMLLQMAHSFLFSKSGISLFSWKYIIIYVAAISLFCLVDEGVHGLEKEYARNKVNTAKMVADRDLPLEYHLRSVEKQIAADPFVALLTVNNGLDLLKSRLMDRYFNKEFLQKYVFTTTICNSGDLLNLGTGSIPVACLDFFSNQLNDYGVRLEDESSFYYLSNYDEHISYVGVFPFFDESRNDMVHLFVEVDARYKEDPFDIANIRNGATASRGMQSSARYSDGRLLNSKGLYNYPVTVPELRYDIGYTKTTRNGYVHFINKLSDRETAVISRRVRPLFPYVVSFSYFMIFFGIFLLLATKPSRKGRILDLPRHSLKRKITFLITGSMIVAISAMTAAIASYTIKSRNAASRGQMDEKIASIQSALSPYCKYAMRYNALRTPQFLAALENVSDVTASDINIYDNRGMLVCSTKPEFFSQFIVGKRMNSEAYHSIAHLSSQRHIAEESLGRLTFNSIYAPLFNESGDMVAIVNVPYISRAADINAATSSTVAMIINLCLVLLITAMITGALLSNSLIKPILAIRDRMNRLAGSSSDEDRHISYHANDELGVLVEAYNKMVDDLDESTKKLARSEREQAWKEMARQIAHEIKNPLTPMQLSIQYMIRLKNQGVPGWEDKIERIGASILEQIDTLTHTASEFSAMAKNLEEEPASIVNIDVLMSKQIDFFNTQDNIEFNYECLPQEPLVNGYRYKLARVFINLIKNSIQAIETSGGSGRIRILLIDYSLNGRPAYRLTFEDSGPGVNEADLNKLFNPNFTTKTSGSGLGLYICKSVIEQSGGAISYSRSEELGGACFTVLLLAEKDVDRTTGEIEVAS